MNLFNIKKPKSKKQRLKELAIKKIISLKRKSSKRFKKEHFFVLVRIYHVFLEKRFGIKKNLTYEEIIKSLKEKKIKRTLKNKIEKFSLQVNEIEYGETEINKDIYKISLAQLEDIIKESI